MRGLIRYHEKRVESAEEGFDKGYETGYLSALRKACIWVIALENPDAENVCPQCWSTKTTTVRGSSGRTSWFCNDCDYYTVPRDMFSILKEI